MTEDEEKWDEISNALPVVPPSDGHDFRDPAVEHHTNMATVCRDYSAEPGALS